MASAPDAAAQIQSIEQHVDGLKRALNRARGVRFVTLLALVAVLAAIVYSFTNMAKRVSSESFVNEVTTLAQKHVTDHQDVYQKEVQAFVDKSYPVVSGAFSAQAQKDLPKFTEALDKERDAFLTNLRDRMDQKLAMKYKELLKKHEDIIVAEFPELKDEATREKVLANFQLVIEKLVKRNYGDEFEAESKKLVALWDSFPAAAEPGQDDPKLEEVLVQHTLQIAAGVMSKVEQPSIVSTPVAATAAAPPKTAENGTAEKRETPPPVDASTDAKPAPPPTEAPKAEEAKVEEAKADAPKAEEPKTDAEKPKEGEPASNPPAASEAPKN